MSKKVPEGIVIADHLYLERDALVKRMQKMKKIALRSWDEFYDRRMQEQKERTKNRQRKIFQMP